MAITVKRLTMASLARHVGLSQPTVSQVLNGRADELRISADTQKRVWEAAHELGYMPNASARAMARGSTGNVTLVLSRQLGVTSSVFHGFLAGVSDALEQRNMHLILAQLADEQLTDPDYMPRILREWISDGLLINYNLGIPQRMLDLIEQHNIPSIWINYKNPHDCVCPDDLAIGRLATRTLLELGHRSIGYVDYFWPEVRHFSRDDRYAGYVAVMHEAGLASQFIGQRGQDLTDQSLEFSLRWLAEADRPTAVVTYAPSIASTVLQAATMLQISVPNQLSIVTIENECQAHIGGIKFDTVIVPEHIIGRTAVEMLMEKIDDPSRRLRPAMIAPQFAAGKSTCAYEAELKSKTLRAALVGGRT